MTIQELRAQLLQHVADDKASHEKLVSSLTDYVLEHPGDHGAFVDVFEHHINEVAASHQMLLSLLDRQITDG